MQNLKKVMAIVLLYTSIFLLAGCYKNESVTITTGEEVTRDVTFSKDIIPIFNSSCNSSGCHNSGGKAPDLTSVKAYTALTNGGYINTGDPESSELYLWMTGQRGTPMPTSGVNKDYNSLVLAWIKQGALNN